MFLSFFFFIAKLKKRKFISGFFRFAFREQILTPKKILATNILRLLLKQYVYSTGTLNFKRKVVINSVNLNVFERMNSNTKKNTLYYIYTKIFCVIIFHFSLPSFFLDVFKKPDALA